MTRPAHGPAAADGDPRQGTVAVLVLGTAEWNAPIATNQHYIVRELAEDSRYGIHYMESMALRHPRATRADLARVISRLGRAIIPRAVSPALDTRRPVPDDVKVTSTMVIPVHTGLAKRINRTLLYAQVEDWLECQNRRILLTYTPVTYELEKFADGAFYHCVDLLGKVPGIDPLLVNSNEERLASENVTAIATSQAVADHLRSCGFASPILWENVADVDVYKAQSVAVPDRSGAIFSGNLTTAKLDVPLLSRIVESGVRLALAGPLGDGSEDSGPIGQLLMHENVEYLGLLDPSRLAQACASRAVGIVPYAINDYTRGVSPLKVYEYLAAGLSVVSTELPGVHADEADVFVCDPEQFVFKVNALAAAPVTGADVTRRTGKADAHSWKGRGEEFRNLFDEVIAKA